MNKVIPNIPRFLFMGSQPFLNQDPLENLEKKSPISKTIENTIFHNRESTCAIWRFINLFYLLFKNSRCTVQESSKCNASRRTASLYMFDDISLEKLQIVLGT